MKEYIATEQYSIIDEKLIHIIYIKSQDLYTIAIERTSDNSWIYSDIPFKTLKDAFRVFDNVMEKAPINKELNHKTKGY